MNAKKIYNRFMTGACIVTAIHYVGYRCTEGFFPDEKEKEDKTK